MSLFFSTTVPKTFLVLRIILRAVIMNVRCASRTVPFVAVKFLMKCEISQQIFRKVAKRQVL